MDEIQREQRRELRRTLIRMLGQVYGRTPDTVSIESLTRVLDAHGHEARQSLQAALRLLEDLGYVQRKEAPVDALDREPATDYRLSGRGFQLLNGDIKDESIDL